MVLYKELCCQRCDCVVDKVITLITGQASRTSKLSDDVLKDKSSSCICRTVLKFLCFITSCEIINFSNYVSVL